MIINLSSHLDLLREQLTNERNRIHSAAEKLPKKKMYFETRNGRKYYKDSQKKYLGTSHSPLVKDIATGHLLSKAVAEIDYQLDILSTYINNYRPFDLNDIAANISPSYDNFDPMILKHLGYEKIPLIEDSSQESAFRTEQLRYFAKDGTAVRSKSEALIIDLYLDYQIDYHYEPLLRLSDGSFLRPDFTAFSKKDGRQKFHEHLGIFNDKLYRKRFYNKMENYISLGYYPGRDIFFTYDDPDGGLDIPQIASVIKLNLL